MEKKSKVSATKKTTRKTPAKKTKSDIKDILVEKTTSLEVEDVSTTKSTRAKSLRSSKAVQKESVATQIEKPDEVKKPSKKEELKTESVKTEVKNDEKNSKEEKNLKVKKPDSKRETSHYSNERSYARYNRGFPNKFGRRKRFCKLCAKGIEYVDYKDVDLLYKYLNHNLKIASRKVTSACSKHQRRISNAIKRARIVALIPFIKD